MKIISKIAVSTLLVGVLTGCSFNIFGGDEKDVVIKPTISEVSLGLRKTELNTENTTVSEKTEYAKTDAGSGYKYNRAFENAPPMIPHNIDDFVPITKENNACLGCHTKDVASSVGATAIPDSHYTNLRTNQKLNDIYQGRYNCTQCHAPQSQGNPLVENNFEPEFRSKDATNKSNLIDNINEGVK